MTDVRKLARLRFRGRASSCDANIGVAKHPRRSRCCEIIVLTPYSARARSASSPRWPGVQRGYYARASKYGRNCAPGAKKPISGAAFGEASSACASVRRPNACCSSVSALVRLHAPGSRE
jgi:hypothetical protein